MYEALRSYYSMLTRHPLSSKRRSKTVSRILSWQASRLRGSNTRTFQYINNTHLKMGRGETGLSVHYYTGLYEYDDMLFVAHALRKSDLFIDVGANGGAYTVLAGAVSGGRVLSFEPTPSTFTRLNENVELNGLTARVTAHPVALGRERKTIGLVIQRSAENHVSLQAGAGVCEVPMLPLDDFADQWTTAAAPAALILKIDVEGWESEVLAGATQLLAQTIPKAVLVELNESSSRYGFSDKATDSLLRSYGLSAYTYNPASRALSPGASASSANTLYLSDPSFFQDRVVQSSPVMVWGKTL